MVQATRARTLNNQGRAQRAKMVQATRTRARSNQERAQAAGMQERAQARALNNQGRAQKPAVVAVVRHPAQTADLPTVGTALGIKGKALP
jgi:hypothetical protein